MVKKIDTGRRVGKTEAQLGIPVRKQALIDACVAAKVQLTDIKTAAERIQALHREYHVFPFLTSEAWLNELERITGFLILDVEDRIAGKITKRE